MPLYTFKCPECGTLDRVFRKVAERNQAPLCRHGAVEHYMARIVEAPAVQADLPGYQSPIDGSWIEGRRARNEDLRRNNCRPWEGIETERAEANKRVAEADAQFEKAIEKGIAETYNGMSADSQRALQQL